MTAPTQAIRDDRRLSAAVRLVLRRYSVQVRQRPVIATGAFLLPAVGDVLTLYAPPLVAARLLGAFARGEELSTVDLVPYVLMFAGLWTAGQVVWRVAVALIARAEIRGIEALYVEAMDELLAKDLAFQSGGFLGETTLSR